MRLGSFTENRNGGQITVLLLLFYHRDVGYEPISRARTAQDCFITPRCHGHIKINNNILIPTCLGALSEWGVKENVVKWCKNRLAYKKKGVYNRRADTNLYDGQVQKDRGEKWNTQNRPFVGAQMNQGLHVHISSKGWCSFSPLAYSFFQSQVGHSCPTGKPLPCLQKWTVLILASSEHH